MLSAPGHIMNGDSSSSAGISLSEDQTSCHMSWHLRSGRAVEVVITSHRTAPGSEIAEYDLLVMRGWAAGTSAAAAYSMNGGRLSASISSSSREPTSCHEFASAIPPPSCGGCGTCSPPCTSGGVVPIMFAVGVVHNDILSLILLGNLMMMDHRS